MHKLLPGALALFLLGCEADPGPAPAANEVSSPKPSAVSAPSAAPSVAAPAPPEVPAPSASAAASAAPVEAPSASAAKTVAAQTKSSKPDAGTPPVDAGSVLALEDAAAPADAGSVEAPSEVSPADAVALDLDQIFAAKKTFSARFKQENTLKVSGVVKKATGTVIAERPNKVSFRYDAPSKNRVVSDGVKLKVYIAEDETMYVSSVDKTEYPGALAFIMGKGLAPSFTFTFNDKAQFAGGPVLLGKPRAPSQFYETALFYVDDALRKARDPGVLRRVLLVDAQGNRNRFDFEGVTVPASVDPSEFTFTPPTGTQIKETP